MSRPLEKNFEDHFCQKLEDHSYRKRLTKDIDLKINIDDSLLTEFLESTQKEELKEIKSILGDRWLAKIKETVNEKLKNNKLFEIIKNGITIETVPIKLIYFKPETTFNKEQLKKYESNIFSYVRQFKFRDTMESIDIVLFLNGFALVTIELKSPFNGQVVDDAVVQYIADRDKTLQIFKTPILHTAADTKNVKITTEFLRNKFKNIVFNKHLSIDKIFYGIFTDSEVAGIGSNDRIKQEYVINNNLFCDNKGGSKFINDALLLYLKNTDNSSANNFSELVSKGVIEPFMREIRNSGLIFVKDVDYDAIERVWLQRFLDAYKIYKGLFLIDMPKTLLVTEVGKPHSKIITLVFQRRGCKVLNFHHGNDSVLVNQHWTYQLLFSHCDNYVVDTEVMRKRFEELSVDNKNIRKKATKFISINSNYYSKLRKYTHHTNSGKIMLMGYPMNLSRYPDGAYLFIIR